MAKSALRAERLDLACLVELPGQPDDGIEFEQSKRGCRIVEAYFACPDLMFQALGERIGIDLQPERQRRLGTDSRADATVSVARDGPVQLQGIAEKSFGAQGVEAENAPSFLDHAERVRIGQTIILG